jgi:hypothetical protein
MCKAWNRSSAATSRNELLSHCINLLTSACVIWTVKLGYSSTVSLYTSLYVLYWSTHESRTTEVVWLILIFYQPLKPLPRWPYNSRLIWQLLLSCPSYPPWICTPELSSTTHIQGMLYVCCKQQSSGCKGSGPGAAHACSSGSLWNSLLSTRASSSSYSGLPKHDFHFPWHQTLWARLPSFILYLWLLPVNIQDDTYTHSGCLRQGVTFFNGQYVGLGMLPWSQNR